jgi:selenium metabolism protein YedF
MKVDRDLLLICRSSGIGDGEPDLGGVLMKKFRRVLLDSGRLPARCIFVNSGIFLTTEGSPVLDQLRGFERGGSEILSCGTCLEYYDREGRLVIGSPTGMTATVDAMLSFARVITP